jgi:hypothetical protein
LFCWFFSLLLSNMLRHRTKLRAARSSSTHSPSVYRSRTTSIIQHPDRARIIALYPHRQSVLSRHPTTVIRAPQRGGAKERNRQSQTQSQPRSRGRCGRCGESVLAVGWERALAPSGDRGGPGTEIRFNRKPGSPPIAPSRATRRATARNDDPSETPAWRE